MPCINDLKKGYAVYPLCDSHVHIAYPMDIDDTERFLDMYMTYFGLKSVVLLALPHSSRVSADDPANNIKALYLKHIFNKKHKDKRVYAFGGLYHNFDARDSAEGFTSQIRDIKRMGFDGLKILLGKPQLRQRLGVGLDDKLLENVWSFCERERFPVTMHLGDPADFWHEGGDFYDKGADFPTLEQLRSECENVLNRHEELNLALCHFYFMSDEPERMDQFMRRYPNVYLDLTPGSEMYANFTRNYEFWNEFFEQYHKRIMFGTDSDNWDSPQILEKCEHSFSYPFNLVRNALEAKSEFIFEDRDLGKLKPFKLSDEAKQSIYHKNAENRLGTPNPTEANQIKQAASELLDKYKSNQIVLGDEKRRSLEMANLQKIADRL